MWEYQYIDLCDRCEVTFYSSQSLHFGVVSDAYTLKITHDVCPVPSQHLACITCEMGYTIPGQILRTERRSDSLQSWAISNVKEAFYHWTFSFHLHPMTQTKCHC